MLDSSSNSSLLLTTAIGLISIPSLYYFLSNKKSNLKSKPLKQNSFQPPNIVPIGDDFNWELQKPYPYRPFKKGTYKMTLAIRKIDPNDFICIEDTYLERVTLRAQLFDKVKLYGCHESGISALKEAYSFVFNFLLQRYPQYFELNLEKNKIHNKITNKWIEANPEGMEPTEMLRTIASNIEEDILILIKNSEDEEYDEYVLRVGISLFPAGFNPLEKINKPLTKIHAPVPGYVNKLQISMNKFFTRLQPNEFIVRNNWSIQTHTKLCAPSGSHATVDEAKVLHPLYPQELDFNKIFFRVEKQCFTRLPKTGADLMFIRTYTTSLMDLRSKLNDEEKDTLCSAIDGLTGGIGTYKRRFQWGDASKSFLNGESDGSNPVPTKYTFTT